MEEAKILPPLMVSFAVTRECNLRCKHCYSEATDSPHPDELTTAEAKRVIAEIAEAGARLLIFDGGEPLMRDDIYQLIAHAQSVGLQPTLGTNATLLSTEAAERMKKAGIRSLAISLHGAEAKSHDDFCGMEGGWERAMAGIQNVATAGIPFQINTCIHHYNLAQFDAIVSLARNLRAVAIEIFRFIPTGRGKEHPDLALTSDEQQWLVSQIIQHQLQDRNMVYRCVGIPQFWVEVEKRVTDKEAMSRFIRSCCGAASRYCCVFYEGTVYPCMVLQKRAGNIREKSFQEIWQESDVLKRLRDRDKLEGKHRQCAYRELCGGARCVVFEKTQSLTKEDKDCWFERKDLKRRAIVVQEAGCRYCGKETLALCQVCQSPACKSHSLSCPFCHARLCHPDVKDCFFQHKCQ
jgi:MoaA/NifB/PqqE/SkfB family radical SAM enzyme